MLVSRSVRLCPACTRVVSLSRRGNEGWRMTLMRYTTSPKRFTQETQLWAPPKRYSHRGLEDLHNMKSVQRYLQQLMEEYEVVSKKVQERDFSESERKTLMRKHTQLLRLSSLCGNIEQARKDLQEVLSWLESSAGSTDEDKHLTLLLKEEEAQISHRILALNKDLVRALVPTDSLDSCDILLEVVAGRTTGGDICQQFAKEMFHMYQGFAYYKNWDFMVLNYTPAIYGGLHHAVVRIAGENVYRHMKHEGGTHRVQRIPEVGLSSRKQCIHTGTMTVVVLPQPVELDIHIEPKDLRIDTFRSGGAGGQSVNTTDSAVRIVHLPTGVTAECQQSRSQLQNRDTAMEMLRARLYQNMTDKNTEQRQKARKQQMGTRNQSERIRTYNFSQDRVSDHRIGCVIRGIKEFMKGGEALEDLILDLLEHSETEALLQVVERSVGLTPAEMSEASD